MVEKVLLSSLALILTYLTWVWGGLRLAWLPPAFWTSLVLLLVLLVTSKGARSSGSACSRVWWRDPFFFWGLLFLGYLSVQWWNAGRVQYFDVGYDEWRYSQPRHPGWPSAFSRDEAAQMLHWFIPAWIMGLILRAPIVSRRSLVILLEGLVYSAGGLALFGVVQFLSGTRLHYWVTPMNDGFFASFGYTNHAAAYFVLMGSLAAGLLYRELFKAERKSWHITLLAVALLLCLVGANLSLSRAGVILAWALAGFVAVYGLIRGWRKLPPAGRVNLAAATVAILCVFYFAVAGFGSADIAREFTVRKPVHHVLFPVLDNINLALSNRPQLAAAAWHIWLDNKVTGVGGWGFRYLVSSYRPKEEWKQLEKSGGNANVHNDILQFLAEFGLIGFSFMVAAFTTLLIPLLRRSQHPFRPSGATVGAGGTVSRRDPLLIMALTGLFLVVLFSLIDLPFRNPAILCTWVVVLAALPKVTEVR